MAYITLQLPPGMAKPGTVYDARGRWFHGNLVRWYEGALQPHGGWAKLQTSTPSVADVNFDGPARSMLAWRDNAQQPTLAAGTNAKLWMFRGGLLADITPATFTAGPADADIEEGQYGEGPFGGGAYGVGVEGVGTLVDAASWQLDTYGQALVACAAHDGRLVWKLNPSNTDVAVVVPNSPTSRAVVVTPERFLVSLASGTSPDAERTIAWADQDDPTDWTPTSVNQAGDFVLTTAGRILAGMRTNQETLIWTDTDLWRMRFIGGQFVYSIQPVSSTGAISRHSMTVVDGRAFWMGARSFYVYDGFTQPIPCEVADYVFSDFNRFQRSKVVCYPESQFGEITWHYPSQGSAENDRYVTLNIRTGVWSVGKLERTSGVDASVFGFPMKADSAGALYQHNISGGEYLNPAGAPLTPFVESGPVEIGDGFHTMTVREIIPDMEGVVAARLYTSFHPVDSEMPHDPITLTGPQPVPVRMSGRSVRLRLEGVTPGWRVGSFRLEVVAAGRR